MRSAYRLVAAALGVITLLLGTAAVTLAVRLGQGFVASGDATHATVWLIGSGR